MVARFYPQPCGTLYRLTAKISYPKYQQNSGVQSLVLALGDQGHLCYHCCLLQIGSAWCPVCSAKPFLTVFLFHWLPGDHRWPQDVDSPWGTETGRELKACICQGAPSLHPQVPPSEPVPFVGVKVVFPGRPEIVSVVHVT